MHLIDSFLPVMAYVLGLRATPSDKSGEYKQVRDDVARLLEQSRQSSLEHCCPQEEYDQARFAVCAWIDETLLASDWDQKQLWQREQLQRLYYNTTDAGVELFERLEQLDHRQNDLREVFYLCLALGFKGRYIGRDAELALEQLKASQLKLLLGGEAGRSSLEGMRLFPEAVAPEAATAAFTKSGLTAVDPVLAMVLAAPLILLGILYLVYRYVLNGLVLPVP